MRPNCFWDRYWVRDGQLFVNFSLSLERVPEVFAKVKLGLGSFSF